MTGSAGARRATPEIIQTGTQLRSVPLVPDIRLHQANDPISLWQRTELTSGRTGLDPPFWAFAWAGGLALARYLLDHPETIRGRHAIDIASGSGLVAIAAAKAGAAAVTAYDIDPVAAVAIRMNAAANGVTVLAVCADVLNQDNLPASGTDLVLVADAFYQRDLAGKVMRFVERGYARGAAPVKPQMRAPPKEARVKAARKARPRSRGRSGPGPRDGSFRALVASPPARRGCRRSRAGGR